MVAGVAIHVSLTFLFFLQPEYLIISYLCGAVVLFNLLGIILISQNKKVLGARIFMISSAFLVPIGMIGALGGRQIIDEQSKLTNVESKQEQDVERKQAQDVESKQEQDVERKQKQDVEEVKTIKPSSKYIKRLYVFSFVFLCLGALGIILGVPHALGFGIFYLIILTSQKNKDILKIYEDSFEAKFAPLAARKYIQFSTVTSVEYASRQKIILHYKNDSLANKLSLPVQMMAEEDLANFLDLVEDKIKNN